MYAATLNTMFISYELPSYAKMKKDPIAGSLLNIGRCGNDLV